MRGRPKTAKVVDGVVEDTPIKADLNTVSITWVRGLFAKQESFNVEEKIRCAWLADSEASPMKRKWGAARLFSG